MYYRIDSWSRNLCGEVGWVIVVGIVVRDLVDIAVDDVPRATKPRRYAVRIPNLSRGCELGRPFVATPRVIYTATLFVSVAVHLVVAHRLGIRNAPHAAWVHRVCSLIPRCRRGHWPCREHGRFTPGVRSRSCHVSRTMTTRQYIYIYIYMRC